MSLYSAIKSANVAGRMGLIVYTIPGYPSPAVFKRVERLLEQSEGVSIVETTIPVTGGFSDHANEFIIEAHKIASFSGTTLESPPGPRKPRLCVLYRQTMEDCGFREALARLHGRAEGLIVEWDEREENAQYCYACESAGIELVQCVGPWMTGNEIENLMRMSRDDSLVYLMSAERTGGQLFSAEALAECADDPTIPPKGEDCRRFRNCNPEACPKIERYTRYRRGDHRDGVPEGYGSRVSGCRPFPPRH